jgi:hypothetical protein
LSTKPTYTKSFISIDNSTTKTTGLGTNYAYIPFIWGSDKYLKWTPSDTTTVIRITPTNVNADSRVWVWRSVLTSSGESALVAAGWEYDGDSDQYRKSLTGTMNFTIPPLAGSAYSVRLGIANHYDPLTATIIS